MWGAHRLRPRVPPEGPACGAWAGVSGMPRVDAPGWMRRKVPRVAAQVSAAEACAQPQVAAPAGEDHALLGLSLNCILKVGIRC